MTPEVDDKIGRPISRVLEPREVVEGAGVVVRRALPHGGLPYEEIDPFLLLDDFDTSHPSFKGEAFPKHPHRGFEIITYILTGEAGHADDFGNQSIVHGGGLQKITAGSGMWHEEGPTPGSKEPTRGLQLWINLSKKDKRVSPEYQALEPEEVPVKEYDGVRVRVLAGEDSPTRLHTPAIYLDVTVAAGVTFSQNTARDHQGFIYMLEGSGTFGSNSVEAREGQILVLGPGDEVTMSSGQESARFVLAVGHAHREPVRWYGPFVD